MILSILVTPLVTPLVGLPGFTFARTSLAATMVSSFPQLQAKAVAVPRMLQVMRACLGQGKRLNDILDRHADEWVITAESPASQTRPIGRLLERLLRAAPCASAIKSQHRDRRASAPGRRRWN